MKGQSLPRPIRRKGAKHTPEVQVGDLKQALANPVDLHRQAPRVPKAREMVEQIKIVGKDSLTAADQAIYEGLLAGAREHGLEEAGHRIPVATIKSFAEVTRTDDLVAMLHRLATTYVKYDIRDEAWRRRGTLPLILAEVAENLETEEAEVRYSIPKAVRELMMSSSSYAMLELAAFPRFHSRYSARLYQRLALRAGYTNGTRKPWEIEPKKLAESLGFTFSGAFRYPDFRRNALEPALRDIGSYVQRFRVSCEPVLESRGRGRPAVARLRFIFEDTDFVPPLASLKATPLPTTVNDEIKRDLLRVESTMPSEFVPDVSMISRLLTHLERRGYGDNSGTRAFQIWDAWVAALDEAFSFESGEGLRQDSPAPQGDIDLCGEVLLDELRDKGLEPTLVAWAEACEQTGRYMSRLTMSVQVHSATQTREEKRVRQTKSNAAHQLEVLPITTRSEYRPHMSALCDPEAFPLTTDLDDRPLVPSLAPALRAVARMTDLGRQRQTMINLLSAVAEYDLEKVASIARAILASSKSTSEIA
ncbi:MAG TPA: replication initiation protein [Bosea sp. (in: a-proteobacteria)]|jgi:hypothetical protein|uniref:replication initiation protein n=1 Tax=Bosea sp. (in: a-proteobacteria) TaxID=1871050 RepID=UPI002E150466|nr:replication initiation protein [Bosea sp. (in: a-proteobacteria)]